MTDGPWLNLHMRALWPHEEEDFMTGGNVIRAWDISVEILLALLEDEHFRKHVKPFWDDEDAMYHRSIRELCFDRDEVQFYKDHCNWKIEQLRMAVISVNSESLEHQAVTDSTIANDKDWDAYLSAAKRLRGKVSDKQAHYWRCRAVARYLNEKEGVKAADAFKRTEITMYACEKVAYNRSEVKSWIEESCPHPELFQKVKPWGEEPQMRPGSRLRETFQALGMVLVMSRQRLREEDLIEECCGRDIRKYAEEETLDSEAAYWKYRKETKKEIKAKNEEDVAKEMKNKIKKWLKPLKPWFEESK